MKLERTIKRGMNKYFLDCNTMALYSVPPKYHYLIEIINSGVASDDNVNEAKETIVINCKEILFVDALTQTL